MSECSAGTSAHTRPFSASKRSIQASGCGAANAAVRSFLPSGAAVPLSLVNLNHYIVSYKFVLLRETVVVCHRCERFPDVTNAHNAERGVCGRQYLIWWVNWV
jgi:hypothetical protein